MTCAFCASAASSLEHGFNVLACRRCAARWIARSPECFGARRGSSADRERYRALLRELGVEHADVLRAITDDRVMRREAA